MRAHAGWNSNLHPLGRVVAAGRTLRGWSQKDLAAASGVAERTLRRLENGDGGIHVGAVHQVFRALEGVGGWNPPSLPQGRVVAAGRTLRGWSQQELAAASGVSERTLRRFELGEQGVSIGAVLQVVRALEVEGVEISGGDRHRIALGVVRGSEVDRLIESEGAELEAVDED